MKLDTIRGLVRPTVTLLFAGGFVLAAFTDAVAAEHLSTITVAVVAYWFGNRTSG